MLSILRKNLYALACDLPTPLYAVGGCVRDFLAKLTPLSKKVDFDICAPLPAEQFVAFAKKHNFQVKSVFKNTETVKLQDENGLEYEYASFRSDKYIRGVHAPVETTFTTDILADAKRRDFTANAVYYDIEKDDFVDPLGGIQAILEKRLTTVAPAKKVFSEDGLRLMRLARQSAQLGFTPDKECMLGAKENAKLIQDISPERIFTELCAILTADKRFGVKDGHYQGLLILNETGVLDYILPELTLGRNMAQRPDFHNYDVLNHSLRAALYAKEDIRLAALLHDVGKPFCVLRDGNSFSHPQEGARLSEEILRRLKAPKRTIEQVSKLVSLHMYDFNCMMKETKLRRFFIKNYPYLPDLFKIKQADFSACKDDVSLAPTCKKWQSILDKMQAEGVPFTLKQLAINGKDLLNAGVPAPQIARVLHALLEHTAIYPHDNKKNKLCALALKMDKAGMR